MSLRLNVFYLKAKQVWQKKMKKFMNLGVFFPVEGLTCEKVLESINKVTQGNF